MREKKEQTASISVRINEDIKRAFFEQLDEKNMSFSKWLRSKIEDELEADNA